MLICCGIIYKNKLLLKINPNILGNVDYFLYVCNYSGIFYTNTTTFKSQTTSKIFKNS